MKKFLALVLALSMSLTLAACTQAPAAGTPSPAPASPAAPAGNQSESESPGVETVRLNVAYNPDYCALWVTITALKMGYFAEEGLDVTLYEFSNGPAQISAMESGSIDLVALGTGAHKLAAAGSADLFCMSHVGNAERIVALKSHGISGVKDLAGKKVGYASGTASETLLINALASVGLTMDDIEAYDMETTSLVTAMISGSIDACATWSPNNLAIEAELGDDAVEISSNLDFIDSYVSLLSFGCMPGYDTEHHDILVRFTRALYKAMDLGSQEDNKKQVAQFIADQCGISFDTAYAQKDDGDFISGGEIYALARDGAMEGYYALLQQSMLDSGALTEKRPVPEYVIFDVMLEAGESMYG